MGKKRKKPTLGGGEFPPELMPAAPHLTLVPGRELTVYGVKELLSVEEEKLILRWDRQILTVCGSKLTLSALAEGGCAVRGEIVSCTVEKRRRR